jgi:hypothetical protein
MTSSKEDDPENKALALLQQIRTGLEEADKIESADERAERLESVLRRVSDVLTLYGANVFTLAVHQVQILKHLTEIESFVRAKLAGKAPELPYFRQKADWDDILN